MAKSETSIDSGVLDELNRLGAARVPIAGWLAGLEARRESVSEPVYRRVREDYSKRIDELDRLARPLRVEATRAIGVLDSELARLATEKEEVEVDLQEIELRRFLEEYTEAEFEERSRVPRERLAELGLELEKLRASRELWLAARGEAVAGAIAETAAPESAASPESTQATGSSSGSWAGVGSAPAPVHPPPAISPLVPTPTGIDLRPLSPASITMPRPIPPPRVSSPAIPIPPSPAPVAAIPASVSMAPLPPPPPPAPPAVPALDHTVVYTPEPPSFFPESVDPGAAGATLRLQATLVPADAGDGSARGHVLSPENTLGRVSENSIQIQHGSVSRHHALLRYTEDGWTLEDLGAENGTWVNGERIEKRRLADGDRVNIGTVRFLFKTG
ncbi:MAG: FHA domain-containing protein [Thermoanaerobaculia bacterium]|jgi:hypothetical protein|nr:FHA domain-containing protein [Thermoanaerobaculia bacterium]MBP9826829.1 FHA domain-containing protein [Thermoanaerobaculia bacterium]